MNSSPDPEVVAVLGLNKNKSGRRLVKWLVGLLALGVVTVVIVGLMRRRAADAVPRYRTEKVERKDLRVTVSATGTLQTLKSVEVGAEVTGRILRVLVDYNDKVKQGQLLAEIDPEQLRAAEEQARAQVLSAESSIKTAQATQTESSLAYQRSREQAKSGLVSAKDLESAAATLARAEASVQSAKASAVVSRANLRAADSKLEKTKIYAPIDGIVLSRAIQPGQTVTAGFTTPILFTLAEDLSKLVLHVNVDEADVGRVREGFEATFTVDAYPERTFASRVLSFRNEPKTSQNVVTYEALLSVDNVDGALRPGMTATATITSELHKNVMVVPNAALRFTPPVEAKFGPPQAQRRSEDKQVYVPRTGTAKPVVVKPGSSDGRMTELLDETLQVGDEVIVDVIEKS
jgi:HlyD family secretion protein